MKYNIEVQSESCFINVKRNNCKSNTKISHLTRSHIMKIIVTVRPLVRRLQKKKHNFCVRHSKLLKYACT